MKSKLDPVCPDSWKQDLVYYKLMFFRGKYFPQELRSLQNSALTVLPEESGVPVRGTFLSKKPPSQLGGPFIFRMLCSSGLSIPDYISGFLSCLVSVITSNAFLLPGDRKNEAFL